MNDYPQLHGLVGVQQTIPGPIKIIGERNKHLGPRIDFARVEIFVEPAEQFEVVDMVAADVGLRKFGYPEQFVRGLLDELVNDREALITRVRITLESAKYDRIDSSLGAFFEAGCDAGRKIRRNISKD